MPRKIKNIAIIDYGVGNLYSIKKALDKFGQNTFITEEADKISGADAVILPGVGSFKAGIEGLKIRNLLKPVKDFAKSGKPMLGICLGAQLMLGKGYEFGTFTGLNIIPGKVVKFRRLKEKVPHIGWNEIYGDKSKIKNQKSKWENTILDSIKENCDVYFVHSYLLQPNKKENILSLTKYGKYEFCSAIKKNNIYGCQFHPEKSGLAGLKILENFVNLI